ncbi:MAG: AAA family ATPase [Candidatus Omnitrophica bacterium]|nr:AAA family ATPase [Candidatus Omnitrophota bacterium]
MIIAVAGKGGTGKTTLAALIVKALKSKKAGSVLAIDADPNANLGEVLGVKNVSSIVEIVDDISENSESIPKGMTKDRYLDMKIQEILNEEEGFDLLSMGRPEGPGCYCFINNLLRDLIARLMKNYDYIIIDNEAGMEHLSRRLVRAVDRLFIVSDSTAVGMRSAARISRLVDELKIKTKEKALIVNKAKEDLGPLQKEIDKTELKVKATLPYDNTIENMALHGKPVFSLKNDNIIAKKIEEIA